MRDIRGINLGLLRQHGVEWYKLMKTSLDVVYAKAIISEYDAKSLVADLQNDEWVNARVAELKSAPKRQVNKVARLAHANGRFSFIFFKGRFNPPDRDAMLKRASNEAYACLMPGCFGALDTPAHFAVCANERVSSIRAETQESMGMGKREENKEMDEKFDKCLLMDDEVVEQLTSAQCVSLALGHKRLWRVRVKARRTVVGGNYPKVGLDEFQAENGG